MYDHGNGSPFLKMNRVRGEMANRSIYNTWESVFHNMDTDVPIEIEMNIDGITSILRFAKENIALLNLAKDVENIGGKVGDYVDLVKGCKVFPVVNLRITRRIF
jgi:hypothetical protein